MATLHTGLGHRSKIGLKSVGLDAVGQKKHARIILESTLRHQHLVARRHTHHEREKREPVAVDFTERHSGISILKRGAILGRQRFPRRIIIWCHHSSLAGKAERRSFIGYLKRLFMTGNKTIGHTIVVGSDHYIPVAGHTEGQFVEVVAHLSRTVERRRNHCVDTAMAGRAHFGRRAYHCAV